MKKFIKEYSLVYLVLLIFIGSVIGYLGAYYLMNISNKYSVNDIEHNVVAAELTDSKTRIIMHRYYIKSDSTIVNETTIGSELIGLSKEKVASDFPGWDIIDFSTEKIELKKEIDSYPPGFYKVSYGGKDGYEYVVAYTFDEDGNEILYETTDFPLSLLSDEMISKIKDGIYIEGEDNFLSQFENYID